MTAVTVSARVSEELSGQLTTLAQAMRRSRSQLIEDAIRAFVTSEMQFLEAVERGIADAEAGRVTEHESVMAEVDRIIENAGR